MGSKNSSLSVSAGYTEIVIESESKNSRGSPDYANVYTNRGVAKYKLNDIGGACKDFRKAISKGRRIRTISSILG